MGERLQYLINTYSKDLIFDGGKVLLSSTIEKTVQENKDLKKEVSIISLRNLGKFSIAHRAGRDINLSNKTIKVPSYWVLKFKSSSVIKNKLKNIS